MSQITQKGATGAVALQAGGTYQNPTDPNLATLVGTRWDLEDGREVIFVSNGATAISTAGVLVQDAAIVSGHQGLVVTAVQAYSANGNVPATVTVTLGGSALSASQYQGGFLMVDSGPGIAQALLISSNPAALSSATGVVITLEDGPNTALTTSSTVCLIPAHGANVVTFPVTSTGAPVGVTLYPVAAGQAAGSTSGTPSYAFVTSKGLASSLSDSVVATAGQAITASTATAGATSLSIGSSAVLGYANQTAVSAKARSVFLNL